MAEDGVGALFVRNEGGLVLWGQRVLDLAPLDALQEQVGGWETVVYYVYGAGELGHGVSGRPSPQSTCPFHHF